MSSGGQPGPGLVQKRVTQLPCALDGEREGRASWKAGLHWAHPKNTSLGSAKGSRASDRLFRAHQSLQEFPSDTWALINGTETNTLGRGEREGQEGEDSSE